MVTLPARMHEVHTWSRLGEPLTIARTRWMFGFQRRLMRRWEWLIDMPNEGCFPQTSQTAATTRHLSKNVFTTRVTEPDEVSIRSWRRSNGWGPATSKR